MSVSRKDVDDSTSGRPVEQMKFQIGLPARKPEVTRIIAVTID